MVVEHEAGQQGGKLKEKNRKTFPAAGSIRALNNG